MTYFTNKYGDQCALVGEAGAVQSLCELLEVAGIRWQDDLGTFDEGFYLSDEPDTEPDTYEAKRVASIVAIVGGHEIYPIQTHNGTAWAVGDYELDFPSREAAEEYARDHAIA